MKKYTITINVYGSSEISVSAKNEKEAIEKAENLFQEQDLADTNFEVADWKTYAIEDDETEERKYLY